MGSKRCPETPRQKMIGMMYLFLMAMLALNVSSEVLVGFRLVDDSVRISIASTQERIDERYRNFDAWHRDQPDHERLAMMHARAQELREASDSLYNYIQNFKVAIVRLGDGRRYDPNAIEIRNPQNLSAAAQYALTFGNGEILRNKLIKHRDLLIRLADNDPQKRAMYTALFDVEPRANRDGVMQRWEQAMFDNMPLGAVVAILTKIQSDVRIAELDLVQFLERQVDAYDFRVDTFEPFWIPSARHLVQGETFTLQVGLAAMDSENMPRFYDSNRQPLELTENGQMGILRRGNLSVGTHTVSGYIVWDDPAYDEPRERTFEQTFTVGAPVATISNVDLNVVYRGIDNRFTASVSGVPAGNVSVRADGADVRQSGLHWIITPTRNEDVIVHVVAEGRTVSSQPFRVLQLPDPSAFLRYRDAGGVIREVSDARLSLATLRSPDLRVVAGYGAGSLLQADFTVVGFAVTTIAGNVRAEGDRLTPRQLQDIERLDRGALITIREIDARGPDGTIRRLNPLNIVLN